MSFVGLEKLALRHGEGGVKHLGKDGGIGGVGKSDEGFGKKIVASEDGGEVVPLGIDGRLAATESGVVHHIVVKEGGRVKHLHEGGHTIGLVVYLAKQGGREKNEDGTKTFPLGFQKIIDDGLHGGFAGREGGGEKNLETCQVIFDGFCDFVQFGHGKVGKTNAKVRKRRDGFAWFLINGNGL